MLDSMTMFDNKPNFLILINDANAAVLNNHIMSITLTENRGFDADILQIQIDDSAGNIILPDRNAEIEISIGFGMKLVNKGKFIVDSISHSGPPDIITIGAHSADFKRDFLERKGKTYEDLTLGSLIEKIASEYGYEFAVAESLKEIKITAKQQTDESDANFLTRLAGEYDAIATIKMGKLLFLENGTGKTASGQSLPVIIHNRADGDKHSYSVSDRDHYTGVEVRYLIKGEGKRKSVIVGEEERVYKVRKIYDSLEGASVAGEKQLNRISRNKASINVNLARGNPNLTAESPLKLVGFKSEIDAEEWIVTTVTHNLNSGNGLVTELMAEIKNTV